MTCPSKAVLSAFIVGDLSESELEEVATHLEDCPECDQAVNLLDSESDEFLKSLRRMPNGFLLTDPAVTDVFPTAELASQPVPAETWGDFRIVREIGRGGMGVVCEAYQGSLNRHVALKFLPERGNLARFRREAKAAGRLHHTNIVPVFGVGEHEGRSYYVMQYIGGRGLDVVIREREAVGSRFSSREAAEVGVQVAEALAYAHGQGVIHRDIKPSNLLMDAQGTVWVTDFGLASDSSDSMTLTDTGDLLGTLRYLAPERLHDRGDARADVYGLGATLYELVCGKPAFNETDRPALLHQILNQGPPRPRLLRPGMEVDLETIILKAMARDPDHRYATAGELAEDLRRFLQDRPILARRAHPLELVGRWCRRNKMVASLLAALAFVFLSGVAGVLWQWGRAVNLAKVATKEADNARERAAAERWALYRATMSAATSALQLNNGEAVRKILSEAPQEHRGWEWHYLASQFEGGRSLRAKGISWRPRSTYPGNLVPIFDCDAARVSLYDLNRPEAESSAVILEPAWQGEPEPAMANSIRDGRRSLDISMDFRFDGRRVVTGAGARDSTGSLWEASTGRGIAVLLGHSGMMRKALFSPDGRRIVTIAENDTEARLWDGETGRSLDVLRGHTGPIRDVVFSSDGAWICTGSNDLTARLWNADTGKPVLVLRGPSHHIDEVAISKDGRRVAAHLEDGDKALLWDGRTGKLIRSVTGGGHPVFRQDGLRLASAGSQLDNRLILLDAEDGRLIARGPRHKNMIINCVFSSDGKKLVSQSTDYTAWLLDGDSGTPIAWLTGHSAEPTTCVFSPDGKRILTAAKDQTIRIWDAATGDLVRVLFGPIRGYYTGDGRHIVGIAEDGSATVWDVESVERGGVLRGHTSYVYDVCFSPDGKWLASSAWDHTVRVWDVETGRQVRSLRHDDEIVWAVSFGPDSRRLVSRSQYGVHLWDMETGERRELKRDRQGNGWPDGSRPSFSPDGLWVAEGNRLWPVQGLSIDSTRPPIPLPIQDQWGMNDLAFRPDNRQLATTASDGLIRLWDLSAAVRLSASGQVLEPEAILRGHFSDIPWMYDDFSHRMTAPIERVAYSADGRMLASVSRDRTARIWDVPKRRQIHVLPHGSVVYAVAFSPDGKRLATGCADRVIRLWDVATGVQVASLQGHSSYIHGLAWSPDGTRLASASGDFTVRIWDTIPPSARAASAATESHFTAIQTRTPSASPTPPSFRR